MTEQEKQVSKTRSSSTPKSDAARFFEKYGELTTLIQNHKFSKDMIMNAGSRSTSYANTQQYKTVMAECCAKVGLAFESSFYNAKTVNAIMPTRAGDKTVFLSTVDAKFTLVDIDTGFSREYTAVGTAKHDAADHSALGAQTYCFRGWYLMNFLLNNAHDDKYERDAFAGEQTAAIVDAPKESKQKTSRPVKTAPQEMIDDIGVKLAELRKREANAGEKFLADFGEVAEDGSFTITSTDVPYVRAVSALQSIEEKLNG